jgi:hypothetical protein
MQRGYFAVAERTAARLVRVHWDGSRPVLVPLWPAIPFIRMRQPVFSLGGNRAAIRLDIEGGLLTTPASQAYLLLELHRQPANVIARVDLVGYRPRFGRLALVRRIYELTQARVHRYVGVRFLREFRASWRHSRDDITDSSAAQRQLGLRALGAGRVRS